MRRRGFRPDEERSYELPFFLLVLALAGAVVWALVDESLVRRPWKRVQAEYAALVRRSPPGGRGPATATATATTPAPAPAAGGVVGESGIRQLVVPGLERNEFGHTIDRVDRCPTCHLAIERGPPDGPEVFRGHPRRWVPFAAGRRDVLLGVHPPARFGCTSCHQGQGLATTRAEAHGWEVPGEKPVAFWDRPMLLGGDLEASCDYCHRSELAVAGAPLLGRGKQLFRQLGCAGCHQLTGYESVAPIGPSLLRIASKVDPGWLVRWLARGPAERLSTRMPAFRLDAGQALQIAAFLLDASEPFTPREPVPSRPGDPKRGKELVAQLGCAGCHRIGDELASPASPPRLRLAYAPELAALKAKAPGAAWLLSWLRRPTDYDPDAHMPSLRLTPPEAADIAAYLLPPAPPPATPRDLRASLTEPRTIAAGKRLVADLGCAGCHEIKGLKTVGRNGPRLDGIAAKDPSELDFGDTGSASYTGPPVKRTWRSWIAHKLETPGLFATRRIQLRMPSYQLTADEIEALTVFLKSLAPPAFSETYQPRPDELGARVNAGEQVEERVNCRGCHALDGGAGDLASRYEDPAMGPPPLAGEGLKVRAEWLFGFMKAPEPLRPWLKVRMPSFALGDRDAATLVDYAAALAGQPVLHDFTWPPPLSSADRAVAEQLFVKLKCLRCHTASTATGGLKISELAPDLSRTPARLRYRWVLAWLRDPQAVQHGTRMPTYFPLMDDDDPKSIYSQVPWLAGGDPQRQIELLAAYLYGLPPKLQQAPAPPARTP
ncbi:MAG TPA: cytochrome c [Anaeromyxobacter sp.]